MNRYLQAGIITLAILAVIFSVIWFLDENRLSTLSTGVENLDLQSETNRILFFYTQVFSGGQNPDFCKVIEESATLRSNEGDFFFSKITAFENANLVGNYEIVKKKYLLNRIELWLYSTQIQKNCDTNETAVLFFYSNKTPCAECNVQGEILDSLRQECPNIKVFALSVDEGVDLVPLIKAQFKATTVPSLVVNNDRVFNRLVSRDELLQNVVCDRPKP